MRKILKNVTIIVPKGNSNLSSISGSYEIFNRANSIWKNKKNKAIFDVKIASFEKHIPLQNGYFTIHPTDVRSIKKSDLIILPSVAYDYEKAIKENQELIQWLSDQHKKGAEIASICTGAFLLAATGLLDGKTCSTHWNAAADFRKMFPKTNLQLDKLIHEEPGIYTNGGAYSFLNLMLFLVEKYADKETAILCSKVFQIEFDRTCQSPFFIFKGQKTHGDQVIMEAQNYIEAHITERISFEELAYKLAVSRRNFDRRFVKATGNTPVEYLQRVKVEVAKQTLEEGNKSVAEVMHEVGYADDKAFREVFKKITSLSPIDYKAKFSEQV